VRAGNTALDDGDDDAAHDAATAVVAMTEVLGVNPLSPVWDHTGPGGADEAMEALDALVADRLAARQSARAARDFETADAIRDRLDEAGILIDDTPSGARWSLARRDGA
jgi:cysteinyl-tRNA synthetase